METNINLNTEAGVDANTTTALGATVNTAIDDTVSMSKVDYEKAIQSEADKVRSKAAKDIKALQAKLDAITPVEKSQSDIDLEKRLAAIEAREQATAQKEQMVNLQASLSTKGLDKGLADYLKADIDVEAFGTLIDSIVNERAKGAGYVPTGHQNNAGMTADEFKKMSYNKREEFALSNPDLAKMLLKTK